MATLIFGLIAWFGITPDKTVSLRIPSLIIIILVFLAWWFYRIAWIIYEQSGIKLPAVKQVTTYGESQTAILILEPSPLFSHNSVVAIYCVEDQFERLIGIGSVINVQEDGLIQVSLIESKSEDENVWKPILENKADKIKYLIVKPYAPANLWRIEK